MSVHIVRGDITKMPVDAIVNAANQEMAGGGGVDHAIHAAAGPELVKETVVYAPLYTGQAVKTKPYNLPAKMIIHTVGPVWYGGKSGEYLALEACYKNSIKLAYNEGARSIAFPAIGAGVYGVPAKQSAEMALKSAWESVLAFPGMEVFLVCYDKAMEQEYLAHYERAKVRAFGIAKALSI